MTSTSCFCSFSPLTLLLLQAPVKACLQEGVLPDCPLFHNKLQFPLPGLPALNLALSILTQQKEGGDVFRRGSSSFSYTNCSQSLTV